MRRPRRDQPIGHRAGTAAWVHWFNTERLHSAIGYRPPVELEDLYRATTATPVLEVA